MNVYISGILQVSDDAKILSLCDYEREPIIVLFIIK